MSSDKQAAGRILRIMHASEVFLLLRLQVKVGMDIDAIRSNLRGDCGPKRHLVMLAQFKDAANNNKTCRCELKAQNRAGPHGFALRCDGVTSECWSGSSSLLFTLIVILAIHVA